MNFLRGSIAMLFLIINTILACIPLFAMGLIRALLPRGTDGRIHATWTRRMDGIIDYWTACNRGLMRLLRMCEVTLQIDPESELQRSNWYLVVSNHQSWSDILLLQTQLRYLIPPIKFFTKRELIWIPALGPAMWLLGFPYVRRVSKTQLAANPELRDADRQLIEKACEGFRLHPTSVLNFTEGTRFTAAKQAAQEARFERLLNPKVGGMQFVLTGLHKELDGLLDITIHYPDGVPSFWDFLCGRCRRATLEARCLTIPPAVLEGARSDDRTALADWIETIWQDKDQRLRDATSQLQ
ncbi:MAG: acetyltransferase [Pseudomonadales bacterium]